MTHKVEIATVKLSGRRLPTVLTCQKQTQFARYQLNEDNSVNISM